MTDTFDWVGSQVQSGDARLVAHGVVTGAAPSLVADLLYTDRSLVVFATTPTGVASPTVVGATSGIDYSAQNTQTNINKLPWTCPVYGIIDSAVTLTFTPGANNVQVWVIAVPDEVVAGTPVNPVHVTGAGGNNAVLVGGGILSYTQSGSQVLNNSAAQLVPAAAAGTINVIDTVTFVNQTVAGQVTLRDGSGTGNPLAGVNLGTTATANPTLNLHWPMINALWVSWTGAGGMQVIACWRVQTAAV